VSTIVRRTARDGTVSYQVKVRVLGERPRSRTFKRKTDATAWAAKAESDMGHGAYVPTSADRRRTLADLIDKFIAEYLPVKPNNKSAEKQVALLAWWKDRAGFVTLDKLTPQTVASYRAELSAQASQRGGGLLSGATVNRYLAALSAVCKWAWKELGWLPSNPVLAITKRSEGAGVVRFLSDDERKALLTAARASTDANIYCAVMLALATGARRGNIFGLRWEHVDFDRLTLHFPDTKNGTPRRVPIVGPAVAALRAQFDRDPTQAGWVFKGRSDDAPANLDNPWAKVRTAAGLTDFRFHDLRHTTASYLTMNGASLAEVAEALGHRTLVMARRYSHMTGDHTRGVLERMADKFLDDPDNPNSGTRR
jgi:integrase